MFWSFGTLGEIFLSVEEAAELVKLISEVAKEVREDKEVRLEQFKTAKKKMDEEDIEYFYEDVRKVDKIENRKNDFQFNSKYRCYGNIWSTRFRVQTAPWSSLHSIFIASFCCHFVKLTRKERL